MIFSIPNLPKNEQNSQTNRAKIDETSFLGALGKPRRSQGRLDSVLSTVPGRLGPLLGSPGRGLGPVLVPKKHPKNDVKSTIKTIN